MNDSEICGTAALLVNEEGEYPLHLRDNIPGMCDPGTQSVIGGNRKGTDGLEDTIRRELLEEAALEVPDLRRLHWFPAAMIPRLRMCPWTEDVVRQHQADVPV